MNWNVNYVTLICQLLGLGALAAAFVGWIYMRVLMIAKMKDLVDKPGLRKVHQAPVPVLGGLAVYFGLLAGVLVGSTFLPKVHTLLPIMIATSMMLYVGTIDDILGLKPVTRMILEGLAILGVIYSSGLCADSFHGLWGIYAFSWWLAVPLTVVAGVGIINAFNMVDGVNGLSSGLCFTCSIFFGVFFAKSGDGANAVLAFCFAGSLIPFIAHNVFGKKSKMFIGDGGTMMMGMLVTWFVIRVMNSEGGIAISKMSRNEMNVIAMLLAIVGVPVFDTLRVMTMRICKGTSPFKADKTHLHHAFLSIGVSHSITALTEIAIDFILIGVWYLAYKLDCTMEWQMYLTVLAAVLLVMGPYFFIHYHQERNTPLLEKMQLAARKTHLGHTTWWLGFQKWLDKGAYEKPTMVEKGKFKKGNEHT